MTDPSYMTLYPIVGLRKRFPAIMLMVPFMLPKGAIGKMQRHRELTAAKVRKRVEMDYLKDDFFAPVVEDIKAGKTSYDYMEAESGFFAIAGAETTATTMTAALWFLEQNPDCLVRLQKDIRTAFKSYDEITGDTTSNLPYLNAVIEETLRRYSPVPTGLLRESPGASVDGLYVPKGIRVSSNSWVAHNNDKDWVEPESFKPERWLGEPSLQNGKEAPVMLAFSLGSYQCLGITMAYLEMRIALAKIIYLYDWEVINGPKDFIAESTGYFLWNKPPYEVKFYPNTTIS
jgi:cytochrome P450